MSDRDNKVIPSGVIDHEAAAAGVATFLGEGEQFTPVLRTFPLSQMLASSLNRAAIIHLDQTVPQASIQFGSNSHMGTNSEMGETHTEATHTEGNSKTEGHSQEGATHVQGHSQAGATEVHGHSQGGETQVYGHSQSGPTGDSALPGTFEPSPLILAAAHSIASPHQFTHPNVWSGSITTVQGNSQFAPGSEMRAASEMRSNTEGGVTEVHANELEGNSKSEGNSKEGHHEFEGTHGADEQAQQRGYGSDADEKAHRFDPTEHHADHDAQERGFASDAEEKAHRFIAHQQSAASSVSRANSEAVAHSTTGATESKGHSEIAQTHVEANNHSSHYEGGAWSQSGSHSGYSPSATPHSNYSIKAGPGIE
jgi:hypothetical protein